MFRKLKTRVKQLLFPDIRYRLRKIPATLGKLGTDYGGWIIPLELLNERSICYLVGAGEDISFDISVANRFHCDVFIFDPTPRAKAHFDEVVMNANKGQALTLSGGYRYEIDRQTIPHLRFYDIGVWKETGTIKFFVPRDESHVSHSILNLQETSTFFEARVEPLSGIMRSNGHSRIDLLKLDIEGAEYEVIDSFIDQGPAIKILCIEFHRDPKGSLDNIRNAVRKLEEHGFAVIARENLDFTFLNMKEQGV